VQQPCTIPGVGGWANDFAANGLGTGTSGDGFSPALSGEHAYGKIRQ